jgi:septum site-determining protein MinC
MPSSQLIAFKGTTVPAIVVTLRGLEPDALCAAAQTLFGNAQDAPESFFAGGLGVLDLSQCAENVALSVPPDDWRAILALFGAHGLRIVGVRGAPGLDASAVAAGLAVFPEERRPAEAAVPVPAAEEDAPLPRIAPPPEVPAPPEALVHSAQVIDRPLRSGQQVHAQGRDLVVLAAVNPGAEVIADGSIHVYAPLRGRALAGARGKADARIFTTCFAAELVSIAGIYRTFEHGITPDLALRPVQVRAAGKEQGERLLLDPLRLD